MHEMASSIMHDHNNDHHEPSPPTSRNSLESLPEVKLEAPFTSYSPYAAADALRRLSILEEEEQDQEPTKPTEEFEPEKRSARPVTPRASTDPTSGLDIHTPLQPPRQRSPYSRSHMRSGSSGSSPMSLSAPPMMRAHSSPAFSSPYSFSHSGGRSTSPLRSPARIRSPYRSGSDEQLRPPTFSTSTFSIVPENIPEDSEIDFTTPRAIKTPNSSYAFPLAHGNTFPRRRRPASPLQHVTIATSRPTTPSTGHPSPLLNPAKFNEAFPSDLQYGMSRSFSSSSVPSTPTSTRSRSPSISSLETIPDSPDAEEKAIEEFNIAKLKAAADKEDGGNEGYRRSSFDSPGVGRGLGGFGRDKRKRWSVCGAERRGDLNLDTIWED